MAERPAPKGRGAMLMEMLKKRQEAQVGAVAENVPPKSRGRAALLHKVQEMKAGGSGEAPPKSTERPPRASMETLSKATSELSVDVSSEPRSFRGEAGQPLKAAANYIKLQVEEDRGVFEYEVRFNPDVDARSNRIKLLNSILGEMSRTKVYDGDFCLYLPMQMITDRKEYPGELPNTGEPVKIILIYKKKRRMSECLHLYNVLFKRLMHVLLYSRMGKNYFSPDHKHLIPQHRLEVFPGYCVSVDEMEGGLMVCLDTQHRVIRSQTAYELLQELNASNPRNFKQFANQNIVGSCVMTKYNNKTYIVDDIAWDMSPKDTFPLKNGGECSFIEYYKKNYNLTIHDVDQPLLINRKSTDVNGQRVEHMICLIPELTFLTGLTDAMRNDFKIMKDVASFTRITPNQRMLALRKYLDQVRNSEMCQNILGGWGLKIAPTATMLEARVLPQEVVKFGGQNHEHRSGTDWNRAAGDYPVTGPVDFINWQLYFTPRDQRNAMNFVQTIVKLGRTMGCIIKEPQLITLADDRTETYMTAIRENVSKETQVVVFICPTLRADRYSVIKKMCCAQIPVASQVILSKTLLNQQRVRTIIHKIALQMTCKLGGTLWNVRIPFNNWMICGIDVYHGTNQPSVCGFVTSIDDELTRWYSEALFQEREIGDFLKVSFRKALISYKSHNGKFPIRLIIFRDGVGDGQLEHCRRYELSQFQEVLKELKIELELTFVVIQKRINTRIFKMAGDNAENPPAGTVVDSVVTRLNLSDFYLVPQSVRQGTVNPTHYIVLYDSGNIKPDYLQRLAYKLCHLYYNWSGTIRVPAPCQYAHKLAGLVGQYIKKVPSAELSDRLFYL